MRSIFLSALLAICAFASPLVDVERTSLTLDSSKSALDAGEILLHLTRLDDLLDDQDSNKLLLERVSHVGISIKTDVADGSITINGQRLPLNAQQGEGFQVETVQAETYALPAEMPAAFYQPERVQALVDSMSTGIISVEVALQSQAVPVDAIASQVDENTVAVAEVEGVSLRKIGIFVKVIEVEGKTLAHESTSYIPLVQLLVVSELDGEIVKHISTLSIGAQESAISGASPTDLLPQVYSNLPPVEGQAEIDGLDEPVSSDNSEEPVPIWQPHRSTSSFMDFLRAMFDQPRVTEEDATRRGKKRPCRMGAGRKGLALGPNAPQVPEIDLDENPTQRHTAGYRHGSQHHQKHHGKHCFWKEFGEGFLLVFTTIGSFFAAVASSLPGAIALALIAGGILFKVTRTLLRSRKYDQLPQYIDDRDFATEEKYSEVVVVEEKAPINEVGFDHEKN